MTELEEIKGKRQGLYTQLRDLRGKRGAEKEGTPAYAKLTGEIDKLTVEAKATQEPYEKAFAAEYGCKPADLRTSCRISPKNLGAKVSPEAMELFWAGAKRMIKKRWNKFKEHLAANKIKEVDLKVARGFFLKRVSPEEKENRKRAAKIAKKKAELRELEGK